MVGVWSVGNGNLGWLSVVGEKAGSGGDVAMWDWVGLVVEVLSLFGSAEPIADQNWHGGWH